MEKGIEQKKEYNILWYTKVHTSYKYLNHNYLNLKNGGQVIMYIPLKYIDC